MKRARAAAHTRDPDTARADARVAELQRRRAAVAGGRGAHQVCGYTDMSFTFPKLSEQHLT